MREKTASGYGAGEWSGRPDYNANCLTCGWHCGAKNERPRIGIMKCERCDTEGHEASECWYHTQYPYGLSRWQQIALLRSALGAATAALTSLGSKPQTLAMCREAMEKTNQGPPCDGPPSDDRDREAFQAEPPTKTGRKS